MKKKCKTEPEGTKTNSNESIGDLTLFLPLEANEYDMVENSVKNEVYKEIKEYWFKQLTEKKFKRVQFSYGYTKRTMTFLCEGIEIGTGKPEWGAKTGKEYFVIKLGKKIKWNNSKI